MENKFYLLKPWLHEILSSIKKEIKTDYLPGSPLFCKTYFGNKPQSRLTSEEIQEAFSKELLSGNEEMAEWVINRWVFRHGELYSHFAEKMIEIHPEFDQIKELSLSESQQILKGAPEAFGARAVYFFSVLNGVVFPEEVFAGLRKAAEKEEVQTREESAQQKKEEDLAKILERHQREVSRLSDKYEQKLAGVLKKYTIEVEALKKQVRSLQQKLAAKS